MLAAALTELAELQAPRRRFLVLRLRVIPLFALGTLEGDDFPHCFDLLSPLRGSNFFCAATHGLRRGLYSFRRFRGSLILGTAYPVLTTR